MIELYYNQIDDQSHFYSRNVLGNNEIQISNNYCGICWHFNMITSQTSNKNSSEFNSKNKAEFVFSFDL